MILGAATAAAKLQQQSVLAVNRLVVTTKCAVL